MQHEEGSRVMDMKLSFGVAGWVIDFVFFSFVKQKRIGMFSILQKLVLY